MDSGGVMRYYIPQFCDSRRGWVDMPQLASKQKKVADDAAKVVAEGSQVATRAIQKPVGWEPREGEEVWPDLFGEKFSMREQVIAARKGKW
jgi:hypothetical protein